MNWILSWNDWMNHIFNRYFIFDEKSPFSSIFDTFWGLFLFHHYQWFPVYWIELSFELNEQNFFEFNNILNWILGKAILNRTLNENSIIESDWVSPAPIPKAREMSFFRRCEAWYFLVKCEGFSSERWSEISCSCRLVVISQKHICDEILCSCTTLWNISQTKYRKKSGVAVQYSKIFQKKYLKKMCR